MPTCDRCSKKTNTFVYSWFNKDLLCTTCAEKEKQDPEYQACRTAEHKAVTEGNLNFEYNPKYRNTSN